MEKCPHPDCDYVAVDFISKYHCETVHKMDREELKEKYGKASDVIDLHKSISNEAVKYARTTTFQMNNSNPYNYIKTGRI